jgi:hypothetical protein
MRTTCLELLEDLFARGTPVDRLDLTLRDLARPLLQLARPRRRDLLRVRFLQARQHFFSEPGALVAGETQHLRE